MFSNTKSSEFRIVTAIPISITLSYKFMVVLIRVVSLHKFTLNIQSTLHFSTKVVVQTSVKDEGNKERASLYL